MMRSRTNPQSRRLAILVTSFGLVGIGLSYSALTTASAASNPARVIVSDAFERQNASGLGSAPVGGPYAVRLPGGTSVSVTGASASIVNLQRGDTAEFSLPTTRATNADQVTTIKVGEISTSRLGLYTTNLMRLQPNGDSFNFTAVVNSAGKVSLSAGENGRNPISRSDPKITVGSHQKLNIESRIVGTNPVHLIGRVWLFGSPAPDWQLSATDTSPDAVKSPGAVGIREYQSTTGAVQTFAITNLIASSFDSSQPATTLKPTSTTTVKATTTTTAATPTGPASKPTAKNTGVPVGTKLTRHDGDVKVTQAGTVIDGWDLHGKLSIAAPNVMVKNSIVRGPDGGQTANGPALIMATSRGTVIQNVEVAPSVPTKYDTGVKGFEFSMLGVNVHGMQDGVMIYGTGNVNIKNSIIWDERHYLKDAGPPSDPTGASHDDGIQIEGGSNINITNTDIQGGYNTGVMMTQNVAKTDHVHFIGDWISSGGGCDINMHDNAKRGPFTDVTIKDTTFSGTPRWSNENCAVIAERVSYPTLTNSFVAGTNQPAVIRRGD